MAGLVELIRRRAGGAPSAKGSTEPKWLSRFALLSLAVYAALCIGPWSGSAWRAEWDSALYLETGRALAEGHGYSYLGEPFYLRPPGLPWLLSLLMGGGGGLPIAAANRLLMACAAGSIIALYFLLKRRFGTLLALSVAWLTGTSPLYVKQFNYILSEFPYLLLVFSGMLLCASWGRLPLCKWRASLGQVPLLVGAFYLRSQALLLMPGVFVLEARRRGWKRALLPTILLAAATLPWMMHSSRLAAESPSPSVQFKLHDYATALFHVDPSDPQSERVSLAGWGERIAQNSAGLLKSALANVHLAASSDDSFELDEKDTQANELPPIEGAAPASASEPNKTSHSALGLLLGALLLAGFLLMLRTGWGLFEWFIAGNTALLLLYFTYAPRLAMPLVPALYLSLLALPLIVCRKRCPWVGQLIANLLTVALLSANLIQLPKNRQEPARSQILRRDVNAMATWARENTPEDAVLLAKQGPMLGLKANRKTYTSRYEHTLGTLDKYQVDYVLFFGGANSLLEREAQRRGGQRWEIQGSKRIVAYRIPR